jgi:CRP-like cAMP-binding protein
MLAPNSADARFMSSEETNDPHPSYRSRYLPSDAAATATPTDEERERFTFLQEVEILNGVDEEVLWLLARLAKAEQYDAGDIVVREGDHWADARFYLIAGGVAEVLKRDEEGVDRPVATLGANEWFGEVGLLAGTPRNATVRAAFTGPISLLSFDAVTFHGVIAEHVLIFRVVRAQRQLGAHGLDNAIAPADRKPLEVRTLGLFTDLPMHDLTAVLHDADQRWLGAGEPVFSEGDKGDRFYVLLDGTVEVVRGDMVLAELGPGDFFGETALLLEQPRNATVRAVDGVHVWSIGTEAFQRIIRHYLLDTTHLRSTIQKRLREDEANQLAS